MKKLLFVTTLFVALFATVSASAQGGPGGDPQQMRQRMIERIKPQLLEKTKITDAEADKVLDIYAGSMSQRREIRMDNSSSEEEKAKKMAAIDEENAKKYKAIPLTDAQVKSISDFFTEMRKNMMNRGGNRQ